MGKEHVDRNLSVVFKKLSTNVVGCFTKLIVKLACIQVHAKLKVVFCISVIQIYNSRRTI